MECHQTEIVLKSLGRAKCDCLDMHQLFVFYLFCFFFHFISQTNKKYVYKWHNRVRHWANWGRGGFNELTHNFDGWQWYDECFIRKSMTDPWNQFVDSLLNIYLYVHGILCVFKEYGFFSFCLTYLATLARMNAIMEARGFVTAHTAQYCCAIEF